MMVEDDSGATYSQTNPIKIPSIPNVWFTLYGKSPFLIGNVNQLCMGHVQLLCSTTQGYFFFLYYSIIPTTHLSLWRPHPPVPSSVHPCNGGDGEVSCLEGVVRIWAWVSSDRKARKQNGHFVNDVRIDLFLFIIKLIMYIYIYIYICLNILLYNYLNNI